MKKFGKNKGHLKMFLYAPSSIDKSKPAPMVVVLHGCLQCAQSVAEQTGWNKLADENGFYLLYPQQRVTNNPQKCFKWYKANNIYKNSGENYSIKEMISFMKKNYSIDSSKVFIMGLSAGGAMTAIMMADYPETFNAGAIFAGLPYKIPANNNSPVVLPDGKERTPEEWGQFVRSQNPDFKGHYPRVIIYQGEEDKVVNKRNGIDLMQQWTNVHHISTTPMETIHGYVGIKDIERNVYRDKEKKDAVIFYKVNNLGHALLVEPGDCKYQGGKMKAFSENKNYNSALFTAYDFGLIPAPVITGKKMVGAMEKHVTFSVPLIENASYQWTFPSDCKVQKNDNSNSIILTWGTNSGCINVTETDASNCKRQYQTLFVSLNEGK